MRAKGQRARERAACWAIELVEQLGELNLRTGLRTGTRWSLGGRNCGDALVRRWHCVMFHTPLMAGSPALEPAQISERSHRALLPLSLCGY